LVQWYEEDWNEQYKLKMEQKKKMNRNESTKVPVVDRQNDLKACPIMMKFYDCLQPLIVSCNSSIPLPIVLNGMIFRCGLIFECFLNFIFYTTHRFPYLCLSYIYRFLYSISQVYTIRTLFELFVEIFDDIWQIMLSILGFVMIFSLRIMRYFGQLVLKCRNGPDSKLYPEHFTNDDFVGRGEKLICCYGKSTSADIENLFSATEAKIVIDFNAW